MLSLSRISHVLAVALFLWPIHGAMAQWTLDPVEYEALMLAGAEAGGLDEEPDATTDEEGWPEDPDAYEDAWWEIDGDPDAEAVAPPEAPSYPVPAGYDVDWTWTWDGAAVAGGSGTFWIVGQFEGGGPESGWLHGSEAWGHDPAGGWAPLSGGVTREHTHRVHRHWFPATDNTDTRVFFWEPGADEGLVERRYQRDDVLRGSDPWDGGWAGADWVERYGDDGMVVEKTGWTNVDRHASSVAGVFTIELRETTYRQWDGDPSWSSLLEERTSQELTANGPIAAEERRRSEDRTFRPDGTLLTSQVHLHELEWTQPINDRDESYRELDDMRLDTYSELPFGLPERRDFLRRERHRVRRVDGTVVKANESYRDGGLVLQNGALVSDRDKPSYDAGRSVSTLTFRDRTFSTFRVWEEAVFGPGSVRDIEFSATCEQVDGLFFVTSNRPIDIFPPLTIEEPPADTVLITLDRLAEATGWSREPWEIPNLTEVR